MFLGQHTIAEAAGILQDTDHRFTVVDKTFQDTLATHPTEMNKLKPFWDTLKTKWAKDKTAANVKMQVTRAASPAALVLGDDKIPAESVYQTILGYTEGDTGDPNIHPNDSIRGIEIQIQGVIGHPIDIDTGRPALDPNNAVQKLAMGDPDTAILQNQTVADMAKAGKTILDNLGIPTNDQCTPAAQAAIRAGMKSQGMPDTAIDAYFATTCKQDRTLRNIAIAAGVALALFFGVQVLAPVVVAVSAMKGKS